ncbi:hypothetical protein ACJIZ3_020673 [Penstemon smallii]|uniref:Knottin scorpion toxin-like domain-containing protein n=1 Tax=Penstemon smallii TaxID=265156 RepID=A0ABD3SJ99_9LAMI
MGNKLSGTLLLLIIFLTHEFMINIEARRCHSKSRHYHGRCFFRNHIRNCKFICKEERFMSGECYRGTCYCSKKCDTPPPLPPPPPPPGDDGGEGGGSTGGGEGGEGGDAGGSGGGDAGGSGGGDGNEGGGGGGGGEDGGASSLKK